MLKAIFWDNDGVLVNTEHLYFLATKQILATVGVDLTEEQYGELFLTQSKGAWHLAAEKGIAAPEVERMRQRRNALYGEMLAAETLLIDGVEEVLSALHGKQMMAVVTSSRRDHFQLIHERTGLLKYFDFVVAEGDYVRSKPDPEPYLKAIERSGVAPGESVAIEDSVRGLTAARAAGLECLIVPSALTRGADFPGARKVLASVRDVLAELAPSN
jgi:HAD superfamily hydrolase (TIGR01509 family)